MVSTRVELTLSGRPALGAVGRVGGGRVVSLGSVSAAQPGPGRVRLPSVRPRGVCACLSLCFSVAVPSPWLV